MLAPSKKDLISIVRNVRMLTIREKLTIVPGVLIQPTRCTKNQASTGLRRLDPLRRRIRPRGREGEQEYVERKKGVLGRRTQDILQKSPASEAHYYLQCFFEYFRFFFTLIIVESL